MTLANRAMEAVGGRARARLAILKIVEPFSMGDRLAVLAEALMETEAQAESAPSEEPSATPAPRRPAPVAKVAPEPKVAAVATPAKKASPSGGQPRRPASPPPARPSPRSGAGGDGTRGKKTAAGNLKSRVFPGKTTGEVAEDLANIVKARPGIGANEIAQGLDTSRDRIVKTLRLAQSLGLIHKTGEKNRTAYYPGTAPAGS